MLSEPSASTQMKMAFCSLGLFLKGQSEAVLGVWAALKAGAGGSQTLQQLGPEVLAGQNSPRPPLAEAQSPQVSISTPPHPAQLVSSQLILQRLTPTRWHVESGDFGDTWLPTFPNQPAL